MSFTRHARHARLITIGCVIVFSTATPAVGQDFEGIDMRSGITVAGEWPVLNHSGPHGLPRPSCDLSIGCSFGPGPRKLELSHNSNLGETE